MLAQVVLLSSRISANPDIPTYRAAVHEGWPDLDLADLERVATCGSVFRALAALQWDCHQLRHEWASWFIRSLRLYTTELTEALSRLDRRTAPSVGPCREVLGA